MALTKIDDRGLTTPIDLLDNEKIRFGTTDNDLEIFHDGSNSYVKHDGGGSLLLIAEGSGEDVYIRANDDIYIQPQTNEDGIKVIGNGAVELYYDNSKKFETYSGGIRTFDHISCGGSVVVADSNKFIAGDGDDLQIYHNGSDSYIDSSTGNLALRTTNAGHISIKTNDEYGIFCAANAAVDLYYDHSKKLETTSIGATITGSLIINNSNYDGLIVKNNDDGSNGAYITLINDSASPSNADIAGIVNFRGKDSSGNDTTYGQIRTYTTDINDGQESGEMTLSVRNANTFQEKLRIKSGGDVSITDGDLIISTSGHGIRANGPNNSTYGELKIQVDVPDGSGSNNEATFKKASSGIVLAFPSGGGIDFSSTSDATGKTSELLDDYEEGTWTPYFGGSSSESGQGYNTQVGSYTKIGNLVTIRFSLALNDKGSTTGTYIMIKSLPFTAAGASYGSNLSLGLLYFANLLDNWIYLGLQLSEGTNNAYIWGKDSAGTSRQYTNLADFADNFECTCSFTYVAS